MESYPVDVDIDPEQVVRWLMVERQRAERAWTSALGASTEDGRSSPVRRTV